MRDPSGKCEGLIVIGQGLGAQAGDPSKGTVKEGDERGSDGASEEGLRNGEFGDEPESVPGEKRRDAVG